MEHRGFEREHEAYADRVARRQHLLMRRAVVRNRAKVREDHDLMDAREALREAIDDLGITVGRIDY